MRLVGMGAVLKSSQTMAVLISYTQKIQGDNMLTSPKYRRVFVTKLSLIGENYFPAYFTREFRCKSYPSLETWLGLAVFA
jgi:uncharacterized protein with HEPN domain